MQFTPEEKTKLKAMLLFLVKRKGNETQGHNGFHLMDLEPLLQEMADQGEIKKRLTIHSNKYFINQ